MAVYVDPLMPWGWKIRGKEVESCHMFTDAVDLTELHKMAQKIGLKRAWFQDKPGHPHYDLTKSRRVAAIANGAIEADFRKATEVMRARRRLMELLNG